MMSLAQLVFKIKLMNKYELLILSSSLAAIYHYISILFLLFFVGTKVQNSNILGLGLTRVQIDKYWILILIREPEFSRRYE